MDLCVSEEELQQFPEINTCTKDKLQFSCIKSSNSFKDRLKLSQPEIEQCLQLETLANTVANKVTKSKEQSDSSAVPIKRKRTRKRGKRRRTVRSRRNKTDRKTGVTHTPRLVKPGLARHRTPNSASVPSLLALPPLLPAKPGVQCGLVAGLPTHFGLSTGLGQPGLARTYSQPSGLPSGRVPSLLSLKVTPVLPGPQGIPSLLHLPLV